MNYRNFISAGPEKCSFTQNVPAPYFRKTFEITEKVSESQLIISGLGFYRLFLNGEEITKGALAPYLSNTDDIVYYDRYDIKDKLLVGKNVFGIILGNGLQNAFGGYTWDFEKSSFQSEPKLSLSLEVTLESGREVRTESDESFKTHPSPIYFDDLWCGEYYDANQEIEGWAQVEFDDSSWNLAKHTTTPKGEQRICMSLPIICTDKLKPISITEQNEGFLYDFGINTAGICQLKLCGTKGQTISMEHGEYLCEGKLALDNIQYTPDGFKQKDIYICKGKGIEIYSPSFTYHGFRYVFVKGITKEQAKPELLTYLVMHADLKERGNFSCSDPMINTLQEITRRSTLANFYHYPTDCPQREKNGWTGDAQLSAEQTVINLEPDISWMEWLRNIRKAQEEDGKLPGIVPTGGWGMGLGGPAWDAVLMNLPFYLYQYRGNTEVLKENEAAIFRYLHYINSARNEKGLLEIGLGDWCPAGHEPRGFKSPIVVTDTALAVDLCSKAATIFQALHKKAEKHYALNLQQEFRESARSHLIDFNTMTVEGNCQTSQGIFLAYHIFENDEIEKAVNALIHLVHKENDHIDTGIIGGRVLFHVLAEYGYADLAFEMITRTDFPSYGNWVKRGATSLWESFDPEGGTVASLNHHMWGDISAWFIKWLAGIQINPSLNNTREVMIQPIFPKKLQFASGWHETPNGKVSSSWRRESDKIVMEILIPESMTGVLRIGDNQVGLRNGKNKILLNNSLLVTEL